jgi:PKD repeat protein
LFDCLKDGSNVNFYNNIIHDSGFENEGVTRNGGIGITSCGNGITIQNNDISGSDIAGINVNTAISGTHTVTVANNNIINGKTGFAVKNSVSSKVKLILTHDYIHNNPDDFNPSSMINQNKATSLNSKRAAAPDRIQSVFSTEEFSSYMTSDIAPLSIQFIEDYIHAIEQNLNFGDGANSIDENPRYVYSTEENTP